MEQQKIDLDALEAALGVRQPLVLHGIHCGHCSRVSRAKWADEWEGKP